MSRHCIRFGLTGCGRISEFHINAIAAAGERARIAAVCDIVPERAARASERLGGVPAFHDLAAMLQAGGLDCVSICTPSGLHTTHGMMAAEAGCHVVTEKPIGLDLPSIDKLVSICRANGKRLFVVLQNRLNPTVTMMRQALERGDFGRIYLGQANVFWTRPQSYYDESPWRGTWNMDGGAFMNQASHYFDLVLWMMGEPVEVTALTGTLARNIQAEDTGCVLVRFDSGAIASINVTMLVHPANLEGSMTLIGESGTARIGGIALNRILKWDFARETELQIEQAGYEPPTVYGHGHTGWYRSVIDELDGGPAVAPDGGEGRKSVRLILAAYESARTGRTVKLRDE